MSNQRSIDSKREEFRKYLENSGVTDCVIRMLTMIYESEERPSDALQFVREQFVQSSPIAFELQQIQKYLENAKEKINALEAENMKLKALESENLKLKEELNSYKCEGLVKHFSQHSISDK